MGRFQVPANVVVVRMVVVQLIKEERVLGITELSAPVCVIQVNQNSDELETLGTLIDSKRELQRRFTESIGWRERVVLNERVRDGSCNEGKSV